LGFQIVKEAPVCFHRGAEAAVEQPHLCQGKWLNFKCPILFDSGGPGRRRGGYGHKLSSRHVHSQMGTPISASCAAPFRKCAVIQKTVHLSLYPPRRPNKSVTVCRLCT